MEEVVRYPDATIRLDEPDTLLCPDDFGDVADERQDAALAVLAVRQGQGRRLTAGS